MPGSPRKAHSRAVKYRDKELVLAAFFKVPHFTAAGTERYPPLAKALAFIAEWRRLGEGHEPKIRPSAIGYGELSAKASPCARPPSAHVGHVPARHPGKRNLRRPLRRRCFWPATRRRLCCSRPVSYQVHTPF